MAKLKILLVILLVAAAGAAGVNYGRGKPLLSNPFEKTLDQKVRDVFK